MATSCGDTSDLRPLLYPSASVYHYTWPHLWRAVAAHCRGAGVGAGARDAAVLVVAAGSRRVPSRAVAGRWRRLLWWWLWWRWLLWWRLLLRSPVIAASVVRVVVIPVVVTPAVLVVATTSTAVETYIGKSICIRGLTQHGWLEPRWSPVKPVNAGALLALPQAPQYSLNTSFPCPDTTPRVTVCRQLCLQWTVSMQGPDV